MFERSLVLLWGLGVIGCGAPSNANESGGGKSGTVTQAIVTGTISASPNPCLVAAGSSTCTTNVSWSGASSSFATLYQILVRMDAGPYKLVSCGNVLSNPGPVPAPWIVAGHTYRFSLRGPATDCAAPAVAAPELAAVTVDGITVRMSASNVDAAFSPSPVLVPSGSPNLGTTTISYAASYGSNMNNVVWVSEFNGATWNPYTNFSCGFQGGAYSDSAPWIQAGHVYRFSLRPTPTSLPCTTADNTYPEVASVTVQGFTSYLKPEQDRCSTTATGSCSTVLHFGSNTTSTAVAVDMSTNGGASWSFVGCSTGHQGTLPTGPIPHDTQALFRLHSGNLCGPTDGPVLATASVFALSNMVVPNKTSLQLGGTDLREIGMNKFDLFRQYIMKPDYQHALSCSESPSLSAQSQAEQGVIDAAAKGVRYLRVAGIGFYAYSPFSTPPDTEPFELKMWQNCPATYWARFDAMLAFVRSRGLKLIVNLDWNQCMFPDLVREHLGDMVKNPASQSRQKLLQYAQDLVTRYKNDTTIQGWELVNELDSLADLDLSHATTLCPYVESPADDYSTDDMVHFMQSFATSVRSWDPKHLISGGYTDLRPAAAHLRARPGFLANGSPNPNMDWTADDRNMFDSEVRYLNPDPIDVVSMHVYNGDLNGDPNLPSDPTRTNMRFGLSGFYNADILDYYKWSSDHVGKPLFVGEFNDAWDCATGCGFPTDPRRNFARAELLKLAALHIPLSTQWAWELSDGPTWYGIKPGADALTDEYIGVYQSMNSYIERTANSVDLTPANAGFELDTNGDGVPDGWSATRPVSLVASTFNGKALTISGGTDLVSDLVVVGTTPSGSPTLVGSVAATTNASGNQMCVIAYSTIDGTGPAVGQGCAAFSSDGSGSFKVYFASTAATGVNSARVQVHAVAGSTQVDDVRLHVLY